jgi:hypothetical protein
MQPLHDSRPFEQMAANAAQGHNVFNIRGFYGGHRRLSQSK